MVFQWTHDEEYVGVTPGLVPAPGTGQVRRIKGRKEWAGTVAVQFQPPAGVRPALAGTVVDGSVDPRDLGAMLIDLSLRGWFQIAKDDEHDDWMFTAATTNPAGDQLSGVEAGLLGAIFPGGRTSVRLRDLKPELAGPMRQAQANIYSEVVQLGWYRRHPKPRGLERLAGRSPRTADGTAVRIQTLGFRKYLETAEASQIKFEEAAGLFSRYLPYAMIFGLADRWAGVISQVFRQAQLEGITLAASDLAMNPFMWMFADDLIDLGGSALLGLTEILTDDNGLFDLGDLGGMVGDVFSSVTDAIDDIDLGDFFDW